MWSELRTKEVNGGCIFDGDNILFIRFNPELDVWNYAESIGKLLFWCWMHHGSWPRWLHPMHMTFIFEGTTSILCLDILKEYIPYLHQMAIDVKINPFLQASKIVEWINNRGLNVCKFEFFNIYYYFNKNLIIFF